MERTFIDREWGIKYILLAIDSIGNSANKERTVKDFIEEIEAMYKVHEGNIEFQEKGELMKKLNRTKICVIDN